MTLTATLQAARDCIEAVKEELARDAAGDFLLGAKDSGAVERISEYDARLAELDAAAPLIADLLHVANLVTVATDENDDRAQGTHYVDKAGTIRCKGSFLELIEHARSAIQRATGEPSQDGGTDD